MSDQTITQEELIKDINQLKDLCTISQTLEIESERIESEDQAEREQEEIQAIKSHL